MTILNEPISVWRVYEWEILLDGWAFWATSAFFLDELVSLALRKTMSWNVIGDALTNFLTFTAIACLQNPSKS